MRWNEARKRAGEPGEVLARRLSNAEYDNAMRDLTGVDRRPSKEFPVDPANPEGLDSTGESLATSPTLLNKYLQAARTAANQTVLTPDWIEFAPHPMLVETDREKYAIQRIVRFYESQPTDYADSLEAAWRRKHRAMLDHSCLMWLNNLWSSSRHDNSRLTVVLAGGMGGELETGRALNYLGAGDEKRKLCSLYLSLMDKMGVKLPRFGDGEERLHGIETELQ
jgi:hypothetical protein